MKRLLLAACILTVAVTPLRAQTVVDQNARETRDRFREILQQYPPSLGQVLQLDPALLTKDDYLAPYPALASYLKQHTEIAHNPAYFLSGVRSGGGEESQRMQTMRMIDQMMAGLLVFSGLMAVVASAVHLIRGLIEHRRWLYAMRIQTDAHTKIVDRLSNNEELLAYLQSPNGQRLLSLAPAINEPTRSASAPIGRILWSMQTGIVVAIGGLGLWIAGGSVIEELSQPLHVIATLAITVGVGFVVSAAASFGLSRQLGLITTSSTHA